MKFYIAVIGLFFGFLLMIPVIFKFRSFMRGQNDFHSIMNDKSSVICFFIGFLLLIISIMYMGAIFGL